MKRTPLERAIAVLYERQTAATVDSHISGIDPRALLVVTIAYLVAMLSVPMLSAGMLVWFAVYPIVSAPLAHIAYERLFVKSLIVLPLLIAIGAFSPIYDHRTAFMAGSVAVSCGWVIFFSTIIRGLLSMQALLLLIYVAGFNRMCSAMSGLHVPAVLVTQLLMVYRYMVVLLEEALVMQRARNARGYGRSSFGVKMWGPFVGQLLLRSLARARRIHRAMLSRGFVATLPAGPRQRWTTPDTVYCFVWIVVFIALRCLNISSFIIQQ